MGAMLLGVIEGESLCDVGAGWGDLATPERLIETFVRVGQSVPSLPRKQVPAAPIAGDDIPLFKSIYKDTSRR